MAKPIPRGKDKNGVPVWQLQISTRRVVDGKRERITETFHGSKKAALDRIKQLELDIDGGLDVKGGFTRFDDYAHGWLEEKSKVLAPRTMSHYRSDVRLLCQIIGGVKLVDITPHMVTATVNEIRKRLAARSGKVPSESSVRRIYVTLRTILNDAVYERCIVSCPCTRKNAPKATPRKRRSLTPEQYTDLRQKLKDSVNDAYMDYAAKERHLRETGHQNKHREAVRGVREIGYHYVALMALCTGMRPSEIMALQWRHIDFTELTITVEQATATGAGGVKSTKSRESVRTLHPNPDLFEALSAWFRFQSSASNNIGLEVGSNTFVACTDCFTQADQSSLNKWWRGWANSHGFDGWELYELRHTQATLLLANGAPINAVQRQLGHSTATMTLNVYGHALDDTMKSLYKCLPC